MLNRIAPLARLAAVLCGVIARECVQTTPPTRKPPDISGQFAALPPRPPAVDETRLRGWTATILARPLFEPARRPPLPTAKTPGFPRLTGIVIARELKEAIFVLPGAPQAVVVTPGSHLDGMLIAGIAATGVLVADGAGTRLMRPSFDREAPPPPPTPARPAMFVDINGQPLFVLGNGGPPPPDPGGVDTTASITSPDATGASP